MEKVLSGKQEIDDYFRIQNEKNRIWNKEKLDKIRAINGQHFITNLRKYPAYFITKFGYALRLNKQNVWIMAENRELPYEILKPSNGSKIFVIL